MRRRTLLEEVGGGGIDPINTSPCDICLYDKKSDELIIVGGEEWSSDTYPSSDYSPVGVVVVPGSHNVYGDGTCGVMSLKYMSTSSPNNGSTSAEGIEWGYYGSDVSRLHNYNEVCYVGSNGNVGETVIGTTSTAYLPSDQFSKVANPHDRETAYYYNDSDKYIPSPYKNDGSFNSEYSRTDSPSSTENAMSDFDGLGNTKLITGQTNNAAYCCSRYRTDGTQQGDWYLPACGELGYMMVRISKINETIEKLRTAYGSSVAASVDTSRYFWSSSEYSSNSARRVVTYNGGVDGNSKGYSIYVRAFLRVNSNRVSNV